MPKIVIGKSDPHFVKLDIDGLLRGRMLVQANSGKGKSWLLRRFAEQLFGKIQVIIIDPEGEFATLREKFDYVLVGKGGETPADVRSAALVAHTLLKVKACAVCDLYEMKPASRHEWVRRFLEALIDAPKDLWHPCIIIVDEAHVFAPEKGAGESEASEAMIGLATRGRKRGFSCIFATQRLGKLRKDAAAELLNIMIGGTFIDIDRKRAADALGVYGPELHPFFDSVKVLERGKFFCLGPAISNERILVEVGPVQTTHPEAGSARHAAEPPPAPQKIKALLPKLADLPKAAEEKAKTESELRGEIRSLKARLRASPTATKEVKVADARGIERAARQLEQAFRKHIAALETRLKSQQRILSGIATTAANADSMKLEIEPFIMPKVSGVEIQTRRTGSQNPRGVVLGNTTLPPKNSYQATVHCVTSTGEEIPPNGKLKAGAERMLAALASWSPNGMTEGQMRAHAGMKKSGTFSSYMSTLRRGGYIEEHNGEIFASASALEYCKHVAPAPSTTEEVLAVWTPKLKEGARRMLDVLVSRRGDPISRENLAQEAGMSKSGTFSSYLSSLKSARLITVNRDGTVAPNKEALFLEG